MAATVFNSGTNQWVHGAAITDPTGGVTQDANARTTIGNLLAALRRSGIIAGAANVGVAHTFDGTTYRNCVNAAIANVTAGGTTDAELRTGVNGALAAMRSAGILAGGTASYGATAWDEDKIAWANSVNVIDVTGGATVDAEARVAANAALVALRSAGILAAD